MRWLALTVAFCVGSLLPLAALYPLYPLYQDQLPTAPWVLVSAWAGQQAEHAREPAPAPTPAAAGDALVAAADSAPAREPPTRDADPVMIPVTVASVQEPPTQSDPGPEQSTAATAGQTPPVPAANVETADPAATPSAERAPSSALASLDSTVLLRGADARLAVGDVASARLFYQRAAEQGDVAAAIALAKSFDPIVLEQAGWRTVPGDPKQAADWYLKAIASGNREAAERLSALLRQYAFEPTAARQ